VARRLERLDQLKAELESRWRVSVEPIEADLAAPEGAAGVLAELAEHKRTVDLLVNNAGNSRVGRFDQVDWELHAERLQLMVVSAFRLCHGVLGGMVDRGWGRVINMSSIAGVFTGFPSDVTYGAIKRMLETFSEGLDLEYRELGVRVTVSLPGPTATEIFTHPGSSADVGDSALFSRFQMTPEYVARRTYAASLAGKPLVLPGRHDAVLVTILLHAPRPVRRSLSRALCKLMDD